MKYYISIFTALLFQSIITNAQQNLSKFEAPVKQTALNSDAEESLPFPYLNGQSIYFVRTYIEGSMKKRARGQEIWSSSKNNGEWSEPSNLFEEANDNGNNAVIGASKDGKRVYVFNSIQTRRKLAKGIAYTEKGEDGEWSSLKKIEIPGFSIGDGLYSFFINSEENVLIVGMPNQDSISNTDLYISTKQTDDTWGSLENMGSSINSEGNELSPYLSSNKRVLYFASDGHGGLGGTDIFISFRKDDSWTNWSKPTNLGAPINSPSFDAYFTLGEKDEVYFTSNRADKYAEIYSSKFIGKSKAAATVRAQFNYRGLPAENVTLKIYDQDGNFLKEVVTDEEGQFEYRKLDADQNYMVKLSEEDLTEFPDAKIYLINTAGTKVKRLSFVENGSFSESANTKLVQGQIASKQEINKPIKIALYDQGGNFLRHVITDDQGHFTYTKLDTDENYIIKIDAEDNSDLIEPEILLLNPISNKMAPLKISKETGSFVATPTKQLKPIKQEIKGKYTAKGSPIANIPLAVYDESGFIVDTLYTDARGEFVYNKLDLDNNFTIKPLNASDSELEDIELVLMSEDENAIVKKENDNSYTYVDKNATSNEKETTTSSLEEVKEVKAPVEENQEVIAKKAPSTNTATPSPKWNNEKAIQILQFDFNSYYLDKEDWSKLHRVATILRRNPSLKAELIGHTDVSGPEEVNIDVSARRAKQAKNYLMKVGIDGSRISTKGMKDTQPVASNETRAGRIKNRRVEVYIHE